MKYVVLHQDDYPDNGGVGWEFFKDEQSALDFIQKRMATPFGKGEPSLANYTLFQGRVLELESVQVTTKIRVKT